MQNQEVDIEIHAYCLMENHYHLLVRQKREKGISTCLANIQNSYTRYFNTKHERTGPLLGSRFHAVRINSETQFLHVSRYIHLNPYTGFVVSDLSALQKYPWSSFGEYIGSLPRSPYSCLETDFLESFFKTKDEHRMFVEDRAEYQRTLGEIQHLLID